MDELMKIKEAAAKYNITKRTLRYYEEIGILSSIRGDGSNYRYYDNKALNRLEQILLLKSVNFQISEIKEILLSQDKKFIDSILQNKLVKLQGEIDNLCAYKKVISSIIKIKEKQGVEGINLYEIIREQVYLNKNFERMIEMNQYLGDIIVVEFGMNIVPCGNKLIDAVKELRKEIESGINKEIPLIRIKDNLQLKDDEYRVLIKGLVIENEIIVDVNENEKVMRIISSLKNAVNKNIDSVMV